ncbi:T9SS type A sorting domain-containing protein [bacterium]|nr:T9SS type A sorting domain-containing protein [FCB group bacterium]MBL7192206.1 T9SS type A sorting domain-containing protein [bacterium]
MKKYLLFILALSLLAAALPAAEPHHQLTRINIRADSEIPMLMQYGLDVVRVEHGKFVEVITIQTELDRLQSAGFDVEVIIPDMEAFYQSRNPDNRTMGGFLTYSEMVDSLFQFHAMYPDITTEPYSIGQSWENRDLWVIKISDNPEIDEDEPEVWYDGIHHAREPITLQLLIYFIDVLLTNYGVNPEITAVVNDRELFILPCMNPDGYVYNEMTNPNGGGMWRKNRRDNGGGVYGVDLNRNYPYDWGHDNQGSSPNPSSETYRGPYPASEPETQVIINYINTRHIAISQSYHSYGNYILYPWCADYNGYTPDHNEFVAIGSVFNSYNGYDPGTVWELLYNVNGGSMDWHYGQQDEHWKIMAFSLEVGNYFAGFWPAPSMIPQLCSENLMVNIYTAQIANQCAPPPIALNYASMIIDDASGNNNGSADPGEDLGLSITINNFGTQGATGVSGTLSSADPYITILNAVSTFPDLPSLGSGTSNTDFEVQVSSSCPIGYNAPLELTLTAAGGYSTVCVFDLLVGNPIYQPAGPDPYGYYAYDHLDDHDLSAYEWIEIDPGLGGAGTLIPFNQDDQTIRIDLPFTFRYYGQDYTQISVCSNGWAAMGSTTITDYSNSPIPDGDGPPAMLAAFWDDLSPQQEGGVYYYYDTANDWFIIEYSGVRQYSPATAHETFEIILLDPTEYITITGDGMIKYQFQSLEDLGSFTVGIENQDQTIGLQILYNGELNPNCPEILDNTAVLFTTGETIPEVVIELTPVNPPIIIPAAGGSFNYLLQINNTSAAPVTFDGWISALLPDSSFYGPILLRENITIGAGASIQRNMTQNVPGGAPAGDYEYIGRVGQHPDLIFSESIFDFSKSGVYLSAGGNWDLTGWDNLIANNSLLPDEFALKQNYPNPFNPVTSIEIAVPNNSHVQVVIYNISGQEVAALYDGMMTAGYHSLKWNAQNLPSGVYFYKMKAGGFTDVKKCLLVK